MRRRDLRVFHQQLRQSLTPPSKMPVTQSTRPRLVTKESSGRDADCDHGPAARKHPTQRKRNKFIRGLHSQASRPMQLEPAHSGMEIDVAS
mmetsp:Transcript_25733/g.56761  ORF Transcript_25733/g.56761 Transcript_25733/m.56761 type:complete len:91 (-) Transcript_25733:414-686(-)